MTSPSGKISNLFLDTNIYLDYFRAISTERLDPLKRLAALTETKEVSVLLPEQVIHEYQRDRMRVAEETREALIIAAKYAPSAHLVLGRDKVEVKAVNKAVKEVRTALDKLLVSFDTEIENEKTAADKHINAVFKSAKVLSDSDDLIKRAHNRYLKGNPPRKTNHSYGDAIIWETLLENADAPLVIISRDGDYAEKQRGKKCLNTFLKKEWESKTAHKITYFESLAEYINHHDRKETIKKEIVDEEKEQQQPALPNRPYGFSSVLGSRPHGMNPYGTYSPGTLESYVFQAGPTAFSYADSVIASQKKIHFCPYCGKSNPIDDFDAFMTSIVGQKCRFCNELIKTQ